MAIATEMKEKLKVLSKKISPSAGSRQKVIVIGSEYHVGHATLLALTQLHDDEVEAFAGTKDKVANAVDLPIQTVKADMADKAGLTRSLVGYDSAYIIVPSNKSGISLTMNGIQAAKDADVKFVLLLCVVPTDVNEEEYETEFAPVKEEIEKSAIDYAVVRLPLEAHTPVAVGDVGKESAKILAHPSKHAGKTYTLEAVQ
ncbi:MAG: hypothetical protein SGILL_007531 [Bacillariaceae sp.]